MPKDENESLRIEMAELRGDIKLLLEKLRVCEAYESRIQIMERQINYFKGFFVGLTALSVLSVLKIIFELF